MMMVNIAVLSALGVIAALLFCLRQILKKNKIFAEYTEKRLYQQELIIAITQSLISSDDSGTLIHNALMMLGMSMKLSRCFLARPNGETGSIQFLYEWVDSKQQLSPLPRREISFASGDILYDVFIVRGDVHLACDNIDDTPELAGAFGGAEFKSFVCVPVTLYSQFWGIIIAQCDTTRHWEEGDIRLLKLAAGAVVSLLMRVETESELIRAKELAELSSRAKTNFLSRMSHEMRTPMNAIIGMTTIARDSADPEKIINCLAKINEASVHLLGVINDILDMSKIETGKFDIVIQEFDFEKMLKRVCGMMDFKLKEKKLNFIVRVDLNIPPRIIADEQRLAQVLINLLANAVKFTSPGGTIIFAVKIVAVEGDLYTLRFNVIDSGIGISSEQIGRLFLPFEQADGGTARKFGGTGLGLPVSKNIVELMGGKIWVESEQEKGSDFAFEVTVERGKTQGSAPSAPPRENPRILVIDEAGDVLDFFREYAAYFQIPCETVSGESDFLRLIKNSGDGSFDFIFVDWRAAAAGFVSIEKLREAFGRDASVIIISQTEWETIKTDALAAGADGFISKPLFSSTITETIGRCLETEKTSDGWDDIIGVFAGKSALLADDVEINQEIVLSLLEKTGIAVDCAGNGAEAVKLFQTNPAKYDVILMDIHMPETDGYEAVRQIRAFESAAKNPEKPRGIPVIAMTANVFQDDIEKCLAAGMNGHIGKPVELDTLIALLREYLL